MGKHELSAFPNAFAQRKYTHLRKSAQLSRGHGDDPGIAMVSCQCDDMIAFGARGHQRRILPLQKHLAVGVSRVQCLVRDVEFDTPVAPRLQKVME